MKTILKKGRFGHFLWTGKARKGEVTITSDTQVGIVISAFQNSQRVLKQGNKLPKYLYEREIRFRGAGCRVAVEFSIGADVDH